MTDRRRHRATPLIAALAVVAFAVAAGFLAGSATGDDRPARPSPVITVTVPGPVTTVTDPPQGPLPSESATPLVSGNG